MTEEQFLAEFESVCRMAFTSGLQTQHMSYASLKRGLITERERRRFTAGCHRGYDKAQSHIVDLIDTLHSRDTQTTETRYRELVFRKIMDGIAYILLQKKFWIARRLIYHYQAPPVTPEALRDAFPYAQANNVNDRQTFSLLADLTTFIHLCDIIRISFRPLPQIEYIELKTGRINVTLAHKLQDTPPIMESLETIKNDPTIEQRIKPQAMRMLRQKIRMSDFMTLLETDKGRDASTGHSIHWTKEVYITDDYCDQLQHILEEAYLHGKAYATIDGCLHIAAAYNVVPRDSIALSHTTLNEAVSSYYSTAPNGAKRAFDQLTR